MIIKNADILSQINWDKEIVNKKHLLCADRDKLGTLAYNAVMVNSYADLYFKNQLEGECDENNISNIIRMYEYFYGKFIFYHSLYYGKDNDIKMTLEQYYEPHIITELHNKYPNIEKSSLPLKIIKMVEKIFLSEIKKADKERKKQLHTFSDTKKMFAKEGVKVIKPIVPKKEGDRNTVALIHDDVQYHMYLMKAEERPQEKVKEEIVDHNIIITYYHEKFIKPIYDFLCKKTNGDIWVMEGGGMQLQAFFGNSSGYLAILYLNMKNSKNHGKQKNYVLDVQWTKNNKIFEGLKVDGIKLKKSTYRDNYE